MAFRPHGCGRPDDARCADDRVRPGLDAARFQSGSHASREPAIISGSFRKTRSIALTDLKVITERDARDLLTDVATSHQEAAAQSATPNKHDAVVAIVHRILAAKNGVRD
jgi:hypothetical protein